MRLARELESLPYPLENPLSTVVSLFHIHVYNQELEKRVIDICSVYGKAQILKKSHLSQKEFELAKNKILAFLGKARAVPRIFAWSFYWFGETFSRFNSGEQRAGRCCGK